MTLPRPFSHFPEDIVRAVFEVAVEEYGKTVGTRLAVVCKKSSQWMIDMLYKKLYFDKQSKAAKFLNSVSTLTDARKSELARHIKELVLDPYVEENMARTFFASCSQLETFVYWPTPSSSKEVNSVDTTPSTLQRLSTHLSWLTGMAKPTLTYLPLSELTELELTDAWTSWSGWDWSGLKSITNLRRLSIDASVLKNVKEAHDLISPSLPASLEFYLIWLLSEGCGQNLNELGNAISGRMDPKLVVGIQYPCQEFPYFDSIVCDNLGESLERWVDEELGPVNHWEEAEKIQRRRRSEPLKCDTWCNHEDEGDEDFEL